MWHGVKGRCQICLKWRLLSTDGHIPNHVLNMSHCLGSNQLPFEKDTGLADQELKRLREQLIKLQGSDKNSITRRINNLKKIVDSYKNAPRRVGLWQIRATFFTEDAYEIEKITHKILHTYLDKQSPIGEVFRCSTQEAIAAVHGAISQCRHKLYKVTLSD